MTNATTRDRTAVRPRVRRGVGGAGTAADCARVAPPAIAPVAPLPPPFSEWLASLREEAATRGIRPEILDRALAGIEPVAQILDRDHSQAEFTLDLAEYLRRRLTTATIRTAQEMYSRHRALLGRSGSSTASTRASSSRSGASSRTSAGSRACGRRFRRWPRSHTTSGGRPSSASELFSALEILNRGDIEITDLKGSWAGALGQPQFMPSSYLEYAQDFDGDGRRDIWTSEPDVFASVAYYMQRHGWTKGEAWGREIKVPAADKGEGARDPEARHRLSRRTAHDRAAAVEGRGRASACDRSAGGPLPATATARVSRAGRDEKLPRLCQLRQPAGYNCAHTYALSVGLLSERLH